MNEFRGRKRAGRALALLVATGAALLSAGCDNASVNYGVGYHTGSYGWGNSFSVGISSHHYRGYPRTRPVRRGP